MTLRRIAGTAVLAVAMVASVNAASAHAASLTATQVQAVVSLLQSFDVSASTIAQVQAALTGTASTTTRGEGEGQGMMPPPGWAVSSSTPLGACPGLRVGLSRGDDGQDVTDLQQTLKDMGEYDGPVTGYFGDMTERAVQMFQLKNGIVASGTPRENGFGFFGPMTRRFMLEHCGPGASATSTPGSREGEGNHPMIPEGHATTTSGDN